MPGHYQWCKCCGCRCVESEGVGSPDSYRLRLGPLTVNALSCKPVYNPLTDETEYFTVEGTFEGLDVCMTADVPSQSYVGYAPVGVVVRQWVNSCAGTAASTSNGCAKVSLTVNPLDDTFVVLVQLLQSETTPDVTDGDWTVASAGPLPAHDLPDGWCKGGFTVPGTVPDLSSDGYSYDDQDWATTGGGTFTLNPCCTPQSTCGEAGEGFAVARYAADGSVARQAVRSGSCCD